MSGLHRVTIVWPSGTTLPILVNLNDNASVISNLLKFALKKNQEFSFLFSNYILDPNEPLESQGVKSDSQIHALIINRTNDFKEHDKKIRRANMQKEMLSILMESHRLQDLHMNAMDLLITPNRFFEMMESYPLIEYSMVRPYTRVPKRPKNVQKAPLPKFWSEEGGLISDLSDASDTEDEEEGNEEGRRNFKSLDGTFPCAHERFGWIW